MERRLEKVIKDFLNCSTSTDTENIFRNDSLAHEFSKKIKARNQKKQFQRHGVVPTEFINYLKYSEIGQHTINWPRGRITLKTLAGLLDGCYKAVMIKKYPMLRNSFI